MKQINVHTITTQSCITQITKRSCKTSSTHENQIFQCEFCLKIFLKSTILDNHRRIHTNIWTCKICNNIFETNWKLQKHKPIHNKISCMFCSNKFQSKKTLDHHLVKYHSSMNSSHVESTSVIRNVWNFIKSPFSASVKDMNITMNKKLKLSEGLQKKQITLCDSSTNLTQPSSTFSSSVSNCEVQ